MLRRLLFAAVLVATIGSGVVGLAVAQEEPEVRLRTNNLFADNGQALRIQYQPDVETPCTDPNERTPLAATMTVEVSAADKTKYKLPGRVIMKSSESGDCFQGLTFDKLKTSKAVRTKLKKAKKLSATYTVDVTAPLTTTLTRKLTIWRDIPSQNCRVKEVVISNKGPVPERGDGTC